MRVMADDGGTEIEEEVWFDGKLPVYESMSRQMQMAIEAKAE